MSARAVGEGRRGQRRRVIDEGSDGESLMRADESIGGELLVKTTSEVVPRSDLLSQGLV